MSIGAVAIDLLVAAEQTWNSIAATFGAPIRGRRCRLSCLCSYSNDGSGGCEGRDNESSNLGERREQSAEQRTWSNGLTFILEYSGVVFRVGCRVYVLN